MKLVVLLMALLLTAPTARTQTQERWSMEKANMWYSQQGWLVGANYMPEDAINQLEMWQADTFDPSQIDKELGWAQSLGMNTMRVFLHDLLWEQDSKGFTKRIDTFLSIADRHHIRPIFVIFDSCWDPRPKLGSQHPPIPGIHNSGWVQSPGAASLENPKQYPRLHSYVAGVVRAFADDKRVLAWDIWNEPDNEGGGNYVKEEPTNKSALVQTLLPHAFAWAREAHPIQPLTSGVWNGDWRGLETMSAVAQIQIRESDIISFHNYGWPEEFERRIHELQQYNRPLICTEYMARGAGSTFDTILPIAKRDHVGAISWGFVAGKTQTYLPWDSWKRPYVEDKPTIWFHDIFYPDGTLYRQREGEIFQSLTRDMHVNDSY
jgi:hypothetical protein